MFVETTGASAKKLGKEPDVDLSQYDFRSGDIVFQHLPGKLGSVICEVTEFTGRLHDARGIDGDIRARIQDEGRRIIGTWTDNQGNRGVFSFEKE